TKGQMAQKNNTEAAQRRLLINLEDFISDRRPVGTRRKTCSRPGPEAFENNCRMWLAQRSRIILLVRRIPAVTSSRESDVEPPDNSGCQELETATARLGDGCFDRCSQTDRHLFRFAGV